MNRSAGTNDIKKTMMINLTDVYKIDLYRSKVQIAVHSSPIDLYLIAHQSVLPKVSSVPWNSFYVKI